MFERQTDAPFANNATAAVIGVGGADPANHEDGWRHFLALAATNATVARTFLKHFFNITIPGGGADADAPLAAGAAFVSCANSSGATPAETKLALEISFWIEVVAQSKYYFKIHFPPLGQTTSILIAPKLLYEG